MPELTVNLPKSWYRHSELQGPPVGSRLSVEGTPGTVRSFRTDPDNPDMLAITVDLDSLAGIPGAGDLDHLSIADPAQDA